MKNDNLIITVVTVVYNDEKALEATIQSVLSQTYPYVEYIVIDGGSTDGTLDIINRYISSISRFVSEPDKGIYDAMNKGMSLATGHWINFMNAGDQFYSSSVIFDIFLDKNKEVDVIYGDTMIDYPSFRRLSLAGFPEQLWKGILCSHQSVFVRTLLLKKSSFDTQFKLGADFDCLLSLYVSGQRFFKLSKVIAIVSAKGQSDQNRLLAIKNWRDSSIKHRLGFKANLFFSGILILTAVKLMLKKGISPKFTENILKYRYSSPKSSTSSRNLTLNLPQ